MGLTGSIGSMGSMGKVQRTKFRSTAKYKLWRCPKVVFSHQSLVTSLQSLVTSHFYPHAPPTCATIKENVPP